MKMAEKVHKLGPTTKTKTGQVCIAHLASVARAQTTAPMHQPNSPIGKTIKKMTTRPLIDAPQDSGNSLFIIQILRLLKLIFLSKCVFLFKSTFYQIV